MLILKEMLCNFLNSPNTRPKPTQDIVTEGAV